MEEYLRANGFEPPPYQLAAQWPLLLQEAMHIHMLTLERRESTVILAEPNNMSVPEADLKAENFSQGQDIEVPKDRLKRRRREESAATPNNSATSLSPKAKLSRTPTAGK